MGVNYQGVPPHTLREYYRHCTADSGVPGTFESRRSNSSSGPMSPIRPLEMWGSSALLIETCGVESTWKKNLAGHFPAILSILRGVIT